MKKLLVLVLAFVFLISGISAFATGEVLDQYNNPVDRDIVKELSVNFPIGQSFTTGEAVENIKIFKVFMNRYTATDFIYLDIFATDENGLPIGESLGQSFVDSQDIPQSSFNWISFIFPTEISLNSNTLYAGIFSTISTETCGFGLTAYSNYAFGKYLTKESGNWLGIATLDLMFETWYIPSPVCDSEHLDLCLTEGECVGAGGYWWGDVCHSEQEPAPERTFTQISVSASTTPAILGMMSGFVNDMWQFIALIIGLPLAFWGVGKVIALVKSSFRLK